MRIDIERYYCYQWLSKTPEIDYKSNIKFILVIMYTMTEIILEINSHIQTTHLAFEFLMYYDI